METQERPPESGWLPDTPPDDSVFRRFLFNQARLNELIAESAGGRVQRTADASLAHAGSPVSYMNQAVLFRPVISLDDPVLGTIESFLAGNEPSTLLSLWPTPDLTLRGWDLVGHPMLVLRSPGPAEVASAPDVSIHLARSPEELATAAQIVIDGYPLGDPGLRRDDLFPAAALTGGLVVRVARVGGDPVAVGNSYIGHGIVNLCLAATLPAARRRGAWKQLVWTRVADSPNLPALAFTSDDSRPGFERMGFLPVTRLTLWSRSR